MNLKVIVKVMNFHALLRVESSRKRAEKYFRLEQEVANYIDMVMNNRNFQLDKKLLRINPSAPPLNLYLGSDYGFCGSINTQVKALLSDDCNSEKIIVGKKIPSNLPGELLRITREEFEESYPRIEEILIASINGMQHSEINVIYNHYYNVSNIQIRKLRIFPIESPAEGHPHIEDFAVEGDPNRLLVNLVLSCLNYSIKIAAVNSSAAENIIRQSATSESLKKIDEQEELELMEQRKLRAQEGFQKVIDSYIKKRGFGGVHS